ncbi:uncharacterized protein N7483_007072 [Penicillium malachiteum]|uniref:uncharacterized protein n=1 Tax=Penicillium malachiteum TaxID=1324776 RepID=UPI00254693AB|nr:uncharacterized protein N7483_007072 [Penicillium malachiteum]KAJ5725715.1 hypothetical protein N7483_007072 [Penicillium malachiteum]
MRLLNWSRNTHGEENLRIFVYSGHASILGITGADRRLELAGQSNPVSGRLQGPTVDWWAARSFLEDYEGDVCYIFDLCSVVALEALGHGDYDGAEFMAASGWGQEATSNPFSFTQALIDTFTALEGQATNLAAIYAQILREAQRNQVESCPVHIPKQNSPSVTIGRTAHHALTRDIASSAHKVLISLTVCEDVPLDLNYWKGWIADYLHPDIISADLTVEGALRGSGIILLTVPVNIWTMMPRNNKAYSFIANVTSHRN